jgi:nucleotidyltransferase/DNA polymerase involved in DNA repair
MYACLHAEGNQALLIECARHFSPRFEEPTANTVLIDLRGLGLLYGSPSEIAAAMLNRVGLPVDLAIASDPDTAIFAACGFRGLTIIPAGKEGDILAPLPLNLMPGSPETAEILDAWGIRTFGEFAALPPLGIAARLGKEGVRLLKLLQLELDARPPVAPVLKIWLELKPVKPRTDQHNLFLAMAPEPTKLEITLAKLSNLLGAENVGTPELLNTHRPDAFTMNRFRVVHRANERSLPLRPTLALRRYRPTKHAQVITRDDRPVHVATLDIQSKVIACAGPWQTSGDWWQPDPWDRDEWDVALSTGVLHRLYKDRRTNRWAVEGIYD